MAQSVKLKDGSYIDASAVYDATQSKTQEEVNAGKQNVLKYKDIAINSGDGTYEFKTHSTGLWRANIPLNTLIGAYTTVYNAFIVYWSTMATYAGIMMDGDANALTLWANTASPVFVVHVRIVYV